MALIAIVPASVVMAEGKLSAEHYTGNPIEEQRKIDNAIKSIKQAETRLETAQEELEDAKLRREKFKAKEL